MIEFPFDGVGNFVLGHGVVEAAKCTFHFAQAAQFFWPRVILHSPIKLSKIAIPVKRKLY